MKKNAFNPYLPSWEYVPDGEPHVFGDRLYVYGSHDLAHGYVFCLGDYICWSAPLNDLSDWRYEGVIFRKEDDPINKEGRMVLYAPDVTQGPDGRYYIYYVYDKINIVSVAVCDSPAGKYSFYGYVHYQDGTRLGERKGDMPQFDPAVLCEGEKTYLYTAFCGNNMKDRIGAMATVLDKDMLTIIEEPVVIVPGDCYSLPEKEALTAANEQKEKAACPYKLSSVNNWAGFKNHAFFEASSIRKVGDTYYFVYSSQVMHELCYATSKNPTGDFVYGGVIVSNCDLGISSYKKADMPAAYGANNHGGFECINGKYFIFYHRHTNGTWFSRQGCAERIYIQQDGSIPQVEITSAGLNEGPLKAEGEYPAYIACNIFTDKPSMYVAPDFPKVSQDGRDKMDGSPYEGPAAAEDSSYIMGIVNKTTLGFKYFEFKGLRRISVKTRGYIHGEFEVRTAWDGKLLGKIKLRDSSNFWEENTGEVEIPDGISPLYLTFAGSGNGYLKSIKFE
ncbi:MAG: family 43 glycosylhydrolase [Treponema sp.]|nr:family 43 glycosylhydrolase [Treponema sp.]